jgi:hypothetical protein
MMNTHSESPGHIPPWAKFIWVVLTAALLLTGVLCTVWAFLDYSHAHHLANFLSPDRSMEAFTLSWFGRLRIASILGSLSAFLLSAFLLILPTRAQTWLFNLPEFMRSYFRRLPADIQLTFQHAGMLLRSRQTILPLSGLLLLAVLVHVWLLQSPFEHDEAYSFTIFAIKPLSIGLRDYHFPNNHVFHTLLMHVSYLLFGVHDWSVRLPAFLAGSLLSPMVYLLGRRWYSQQTGILAGVAVAALPVITDYATNARGYTLVALFGLLIFAIASELIQKNNRLLWILLPIFSALGFYTVPVFLYPFGMVYTWLILVWITARFSSEYSRTGFLFALLLSVLVALGLTGLLYLPVITYSGFDAVFANPVIKSLSWQDFFPDLSGRMVAIGTQWTQGVSIFLSALAIIGLAASFLLHRRAGRRMPLLTQASLLFVPIILLVQRPTAYEKTWFFLLPFLLIWSSAGLISLLEVLFTKMKFRTQAVNLSAFFLAGTLLFTAGRFTLTSLPGLKPYYGPVEQSVRYLQSSLQEDQVVVVDANDDAPTWYYFYKYGLSQQALRRDIPFKSAYVMVDSAQGQTLESVVKNRGPDMVFFDWPTEKIAAKFGDIQIIWVEADHQAVQKAYSQVQQ